MLSEEALILLVAVAACALMVLGILKLVRPPSRRDPVPRPRPTTVARGIEARPASAVTEVRARAVPAVASSDRAPIGVRVQGRYRIASELGTSAYGTVCRAEDERTGHGVAIRFLPRAIALAPHAVRAIQRTGQSIVAASTAHPGLVRVQEFAEAENGQLFVAMELVEGRRLSEILSEGTALDVGAALRLALDLAGAVELLHQLGVVHGAIRPRNVIVFEDGRVKLMDSELSALRDALVMEGVVAAKPLAEYRAPEQIRRTPVSEKADVYAFAVVVYEMLCGVPPFSGPTRETVLARHLTETPVPMRRRRRAVPAAVERIVTQALDKQPEQRPLMQELIDVLKAEANGPDDTRARAPRLFRQLGQWVERRLSSIRHGEWRGAAPRRSPSTPHDEASDDPQRVVRWLAESQDVLSRVVPALVDDCDRLRRTLGVKEREGERLRGERDAFRRDVDALRAEVETLRGERAAMAQAFGDVVDVMKRLERPLDEVARRVGT